jgi:hypothetical protein
VKPAEAVTDDGSKVSHGGARTQVECHHHEQGATVMKSTPTCKTKAGADLPLSDCCVNADGTEMPNCTMKLQPAE